MDSPHVAFQSRQDDRQRVFLHCSKPFSIERSFALAGGRSSRRAGFPARAHERRSSQTHRNTGGKRNLLSTMSWENQQLALALPAAPASPAQLAAAEAARQLLDVSLIYCEPGVETFARGREILARFPLAERRETASHWQIPGLHGNAGSVDSWVQIKRTILVLGARKSFPFRDNGRSSDFVAPGASNGCAMACAYCYVPRRKGFANPITAYVNIEAICRAIARHAARLPRRRPEPSQVDPLLWVYEIGENGDCSADALLSENVRDLVALFRLLPNAKATFATKFVNRALLGYDPQGKTRLRFSLMPPKMSRLVDVRTSPIEERIAAVNDFVAAGYEVHLNFSPVIVYEGWQADYAALFEQADDLLDAHAKAQLAAEVIFLTHNAGLHEVNLGWHPKAEAHLWRPEWQEAKISHTGGENVRYRHGFKGRLIARMRELMAKHLPYCRIRYAF
jgi:spore photoproduct lyase